MFWHYLGQSLWTTLFWWLYIFPLIFKIIVGIIKYSVLNVTTWFRGWRPVATEIAEAGVRRGIAKGDYPPNPPDAVMKNEMFKANLQLVGGAVVNIYIVCFTYLLIFH